MAVDTFETLPALPEPPNTRTDTKPAFLQKADAFNPALKAWADSLNASFIDNLNALVALLNQQLPYLNAVADADAAIRAVFNNLAGVNTVSSGIESVNTTATWAEQIRIVADNIAAVLGAKGYAEEAKKWALMAETVTNIRPATPTTLGLVRPKDGLAVDANGLLTVNTGSGLTIAEDGTVALEKPLSVMPLADAVPVAGEDGKLNAWVDLPQGAGGATMLEISENLVLTADSPKKMALSATIPERKVYLADIATLREDGVSFVIVNYGKNKIQVVDHDVHPLGADSGYIEQGQARAYFLSIRQPRRGPF